MPARLQISSALAVAVALGAIVGVGCAKDEENAPSASGVFAPVAQQGAGDTAPTATPANAAGCEALGTLVGNGLEASLDSATLRSVAVPLVARTVATRVSVRGVGASSDLSGKTIALGVAANTGNETCTHCLLIAVGCAGGDCSNATYYFPRSGTATFTAVASAEGQPFGGRFSDVVLEHVTIDPATGATRTVGDARCLYVRDLAFNAIVPTKELSAPPAATDGGATDSGTSSSSSSGIIGSSSGGGGAEPGKEDETSSGGTSKGGGGGGTGNL